MTDKTTPSAAPDNNIDRELETELTLLQQQWQGSAAGATTRSTGHGGAAAGALRAERGHQQPAATALALDTEMDP